MGLNELTILEQSKAKQSKAKQSKAKQSKAKQSKAKQSIDSAIICVTYFSGYKGTKSLI